MQKENTQQTTLRTRRFTVLGEYDNAHRYGDDQLEIKDGDVCAVKPGASYKDGDIVLITCRCNGEEHFHAQFFHVCHGHKYKFTLSTWGNRRSGTRYKAGAEKMIVGPVLRVIKKGEKPTAKGKSKGQLTSYRTVFEWSYFGVHYGDSLVVKKDGQATVGQLILVWNKKKDDSYFNRCCLVKDGAVRVSGADEESYDIAPDRVIGAVVEIRHDDCNHTKIEALQAKIAELQTSDDPISHTSKCYELEKQIFALEHPPEEADEDDDFEWPDELDG